MDACRAQRQSLAEEFKELQSFFVALGDETRQQIFSLCWNMKPLECGCRKSPDEPTFLARQCLTTCAS